MKKHSLTFIFLIIASFHFARPARLWTTFPWPAKYWKWRGNMLSICLPIMSHPSAAIRFFTFYTEEVMTRPAGYSSVRFCILLMRLLMQELPLHDYCYAWCKYGSERLPEFCQGDWRYEDFFFEEFMPFIEKTYRIKGEKRYRAWQVYQWAGRDIYIALHHPELFSSACPLSAGTGPMSIEELKNYKAWQGLKVLLMQTESHILKNTVFSILLKTFPIIKRGPSGGTSIAVMMISFMKVTRWLTSQCVRRDTSWIPHPRRWPHMDLTGEPHCRRCWIRIDEFPSVLILAPLQGVGGRFPSSMSSCAMIRMRSLIIW